MENASLPTIALTSPSGEDRGRVAVELALDDQTRARGLMERTAVPPGTGMLFVFLDEQVRTFWMQNVPIPLDMLFADRDGVIVDIAENVPPCLEDPCPTVVSARPAMYVLELAGGGSRRLGLERGGAMELQGIPAARN